MDKVVRDGKVAVLVSPGFGAGWSTWGSDTAGISLVFDPGLVALAERSADEQELVDYLTEKLGPEHYVYTGGWKQVTIEWLDEGTQFTIEEYDGSESIRTVADLLYTA